MQILTEHNLPFPMNVIPDDDSDVRYGVLDYSDQKNVDYYFLPLVFLESFDSPAAELEIGEYRILMPLDWNVVVGDRHLGELEILPITSLNDRDFDMLIYNPLSAFRPEFSTIRIINVYPEKRWYFPRLKFGHLLVTPLTMAPTHTTTATPSGKKFTRTHLPCGLFVKETTKLPEVLDISKMV